MADLISTKPLPPIKAAAGNVIAARILRAAIQAAVEDLITLPVKSERA
jgi:hypothetical protein